MTRLLILLFCISCFCSAHLAAEEKTRDLDAGFGEWKVLFDGKSTTGWQTAKTRQAGGKNLWAAEDGALANIRGGVNDICTVEEFTDYEL